MDLADFPRGSVKRTKGLKMDEDISEIVSSKRKRSAMNDGMTFIKYLSCKKRVLGRVIVISNIRQ